MDEVARLLQRQAGVITRTQLATCGAGPADLERLLRRRELVRVLPGVFVDHTGAPTWEQRAWAGVLFYRPAALVGDSALRAAGVHRSAHGDAGPIEIGIDRRRSRQSRPGYRLRWTTDLEARSLWNTSPPRERVEHAVLDVAARASSDWAAIAALSEACQARRTTARHIRVALGERDRIGRRAWLASVLNDIAEGTCSALEHAYLTRVERAHDLPRAARQAPGSSDRGAIYRDVTYERFGLFVELDGRLFHDSALGRDADLDRDLEAAVAGRRTVRLGWGQVVERPCWTTLRVAVLLRAGGWDGSPTACAPGCPARPVPRR
jgi:hypothetical protein